jgi:pimeloyl-ACP methyl ester carboxylesterase
MASPVGATSPVGHVIYLHGFASSPDSGKAHRFREELARRGVGSSCPDFNRPEFETLTVTRMLQQTADELVKADGDPVALVGSSLGAFVALHAAARDGTARIDRLILLAPALDFGGNRLRQLGEHGIEEWKRTGSLRVFHYAFNEEREVGYALYEDAAKYDAFTVDVKLPMLVYQGRRDASVDPRMVEQWARGRKNIDLRLVDDEHQLTASMDEIWRESAPLLGLQA